MLLMNLNLLSFDENGRIDWIQNTLANQLLSDRNRAVVRDAKVGQVIEEPRVPTLHVLLNESDERLDLRGLYRKRFVLLNRSFCIELVPSQLFICNIITCR